MSAPTAELAAATAAAVPSPVAPDAASAASADLSAAMPSASAAPSASAFAGPWHILLFYRYTPIAASGLESVERWQRGLCERLGLKGRIRLAHEGINATLGGSKQATEAYVEAMNSEGPSDGPQQGHKLFEGIEYKRSTSDREPFPSLGLFRVHELTASGKMGKSKPPGLAPAPPAAAGAASGEVESAASAAAAAPAPASVSSSSASFAADVPTSSLHLTPAQWHEALSSFDPETMLLLDVRNAYETAIGTFEGAVDPKLRAFHQLPSFINQTLAVIHTKKKLLMLCAGAIRCDKEQKLAHGSSRTGHADIAARRRDSQVHGLVSRRWSFPRQELHF